MIDLGQFPPSDADSTTEVRWTGSCIIV